MNNEQVMRQALEALEADDSKLWPSDKRTSAIIALRAALEEYDDEPTYCPTCGEEDGGTTCGMPDCGLRLGADSVQDWALLEATQASLREHMAEIHRLRAALAEPVQEPIKWTLDGDKQCGYNNWVGETPFGRILITWKGWKAHPDACVDEFPGGFQAYGEPEEVKAACDAEFARRHGSAPPQRPAEPAQEPFCYVYEYDSPYGLHREFYPREYNGMKPSRTVPLYTAPPQRKPLTEEEIIDAVRDADLDWTKGWALDETHGNRFATLARAIERAHGIGE